MNPSTTALTLNVQLPNIATVAWAVQGDQLSRHLECTLVDGSTAWTPQAGYHAMVRAHKPDGTACVYDVDEDGNPAVTWSGNVATVTIAQQAITVAGTVLMQLEFYDSNNARLTAFAWAMNVQPSAVTDNEFLSADYYNILTLQIAAVLGSSGHPPYIDSTTKNWMIWSETAGAYVDSGFSSVGETGPTGPQGPQGVSITNVTKASGTGAPGTTDTYNVNLSSGSVAGQFNVYNGADGQGSPGSQLPLMDGTASAGSAAAYSREDHVHPSDTSKANVAAVLQGAASTISAAGTTNVPLAGLTEDHVVGNWGMFSDAELTTPIPENAPTCDITITTSTTSAGSYSITVENFSSTFYIRPTFVLKQN